MELNAQHMLIVSSSPHVKSGRTTQKIMLDVIIALIPALVAGCVIFGLRSLAVVAACVSSCVLAEILFNVITKREHTIFDLSAVVTGLLLGLNLPATLPIWQAVVGSVFAIVIVKCLFGGLGKNFANPAIAARVMMLLSFSKTMGDVVYPVADARLFDAATAATPLAKLAEGTLPNKSILDMLLGLRAGALGETCIIALVLGGVYLLIRRVITWHTPVAFIAGVYLLSLLVYGGDPVFALYMLLSGGVFIGAIFMATDYVTTPTTAWGKLIFGLGCAVLTVVIRKWAAYPEGVSFSILLMNILTPYIEKATIKKPLGEVKA